MTDHSSVTANRAEERVSQGVLDGRTILRFAHAYESGGGTERYLDDLDRVLLERNRLTIFRLHLTRNRNAPARSLLEIGKGRLVLIPLQILESGTPLGTAEEHSPKERMRRVVRDCFLYNPIVWSAWGRKWTNRLSLPHKSGQAIHAGQWTKSLLEEGKIDLAMLHFFGGADAQEVIDHARAAGVPVALLNHFANDRLLHLSVRKHIMQSNAVAGVNQQDLPEYLKDRFTNLSDGVDTAFFSASKARPLEKTPTEPIILLPARVTREKGHLDLLRAAAALNERGIKCSLAFAGRSEPGPFTGELQNAISKQGLVNRVHFLGSLSLNLLRDWYGACAVVALPTYHHEGLPRVVLEAQSMGKPVVAYSKGGVKEGLIDGRSGYVLRAGDINGLVARLAELLSSNKRLQEFGAVAQKLANDRFSLVHLAERHELFYSSLFGSPKITSNHHK